MKYLLNVLIIMALLVLSGCGPRTEVFAPVKPEVPAKTGTIALISGYGQEEEIVIINRLEKRLTETGFHLMLQPEVRKKIPIYPCNIIQNDFKTDDENYSAWLSPENQKRAENVWRKIKTDYIMLIWTDDGYTLESNKWFTQVHLWFNARLISYPNGAVVGYTTFGHTISAFPFEDLKNTEKRLCEEAADRIAQQMLATLR